ncbi:recombination regulator RecX [Clostridium sp. SM-530-WT-3G]|uniref:recombination regulator RecX n=1 Tax=Clostridium sp. SM-530-WT-3G TaxID=2725303 RepID=UPI00145CC3CB|nr:recombination regulator RecX [Clostridium sp. SM-530-WT-3G]NME83220.1 recombination regulator RecX [Clostridium sp. SM-530-WT-3G]
MAVITKIEVQKRNKDRVNIYLDNEYAFSISMELVYKEGLKSKMEIDVDRLRDIADKEGYLKCKNTALRIVERSFKTEKEMRDKLKEKEYTDDQIEKTIEFLKEYKFINDEAYVNAYVNDKLSSRGRQKIKYDLIRKGIERNLIEEKLSDIDSDDEKNTALNLAKKKYNSIKKSESDVYKINGKLYRFLMSKGYNYELIKDVVKRVTNVTDEYL